jgi:multicomponent Na+:H+ antiporter subunit D
MMNTLTISCLILPFISGFIIFLLPRLDRYLSVITAICSGLYSLFVLVTRTQINLKLIDTFGVTLSVDEQSGYFMLTNALITLAVICYCWSTDKSAFFYGQLMILHASINACFVSTDFINLYVALEVSGIAAALLIAYPRSDRSIWIALRYLFVSNVCMLLYLIGAVLAYKSALTFSFSSINTAPPEALALIFMGLLTKGGLFLSGLWLPLTHAESEVAVSALLSGIVVKAGLFPLLRCGLLLEQINPVIHFFGVGTAVFGVCYAIFAQDTKRLLAFSTISQLGFILSAPQVGGFYALTHGLVKSCLFILAGALPSRSFGELARQPISHQLWSAILLAGFSISGFPLLSGFGAKVLTMKNLLPWQNWVMNLVAVGTAIAFAKFVFLPHHSVPQKLPLGFWVAVGILLGGLLVANVAYLEAYNLENMLKAIAIVFAGWSIYYLIFSQFSLNLPRKLESFEHLMGMMILVAIVLFWVAVNDYGF